MTTIRFNAAAGRQTARVVIERSWTRILRVEATAAANSVLAGVVRLLKRTLPRRTGLLRRRTTRLLFRMDSPRRFRIWSQARYSKWVITAPPAWTRAAARVRTDLRGWRKTIYFPVRVTVGGRTRRFRMPYRFSMRKLNPRARTNAIVRLKNEIRGQFRNPAILKPDIERQARAWFNREVRRRLAA